MAGQMSWAEFKVDLRQLHNAIGDVQRESGTIRDTMSSIASEFSLVKDSWDTPSEQTFDAVQAWLMRVTHDLENILQDSIGRMQRAYENYHRAEEANVKNNTPHGGGSHNSGGSHNNGGHHEKALYTDRQKPAGSRTEQATLRVGEISGDGSAAMPLHDRVTDLAPPAAG
jgi:WXG100 family type VII secretion target